MRKKICILLSVILIFGSIPFTAFAEESAETPKQENVIEQVSEETEETEEPEVNEEPEGEEVLPKAEEIFGLQGNMQDVAEIDGKGSYSSVANAISAAEDGDTVRLIANTEECFAVAKTVTLDLNGFVIAGDGTDSVIKNSGNLTIEDNSTKENVFEVLADGRWKYLSSAPQTIHYDFRKGILTVHNSDEVYNGIPATGKMIAVTGGCIINGVGTEVSTENNNACGGGVYNSGVLTLSGVTIAGNTAYKGGAVYNAPNATMTATDTCFIGNTAGQQAAGIFDKNSTVTDTLENCCISYNSAKEYGAGISTSGTVSITNCEITYNRLTYSSRNYGAGMDWWGGSLVFSGYVRIYDNTTNGRQDNFLMEFDEDIEMNRFAINGELGANSKIGLAHMKAALPEVPVILSSGNTADNSPYFEGDEEYPILYKGSDLIMVEYCHVKTTGNDSNNGTYNSPYQTIDKALAVCAANGGGVIALQDTVTLEADLTIPSGVRLLLHGIGRTINEGGHKVTFLIGTEKDLINAAAACENTANGFCATWELENSIPLSCTVKTTRNITLNGNRYTITAEQSENVKAESCVLSFENSTATATNVEINELTVVIGDGFRNGLLFHKQTGCEAVTAVLNNVSVIAARTTAPTDSEGTEKTGNLIQNNSCFIVLTENVSLTADSYCWTAVDVDNEKGNAEFTFAPEIKAEFKDDREDRWKAAEPFVGMSDSSGGVTPVTVNGAKETGLLLVSAGTTVARGCHTQKRTKDGYDVPVIYRPDPDQDDHLKTGWNGSGTQWIYIKANGEPARNEWVEIEAGGVKKWYHFGDNAMMQTGWFKDVDGRWYYLSRENGTNIGVMQTGWFRDTDGSWYYFSTKKGAPLGSMQTGWITDANDGYRYYLDPATGKMLIGWHVLDGKRYCFNDEVPAYSGWSQNANGEWVYDKQKVIPLGALKQ